MPSMKISLLALATAVAAVPQYGGHGHSKFHNKPSGVHGTGKPYPSGGWGGYNATGVAGPTGGSGGDKTIDVTSTSTTTIMKTVTIKPSPAAPISENKPVVENVTPPAGGQCGPATVTVTASEKVTVTVTPGAPEAPKSSAAAVGEQTTTSTIKVTTKAEEIKTTKVPQAPQSSSKAEEYKVTPIAEKPVASSAAPVSSAAPSKAPSSGNTYTGSKRGLAYNKAELCKSFSGKFGFGYNWGQIENNDIGTPFIPMMHSPSKSSSQEWLANVDRAVKKGSKAVFGFNEPDHSTQANLSPEAACSAWKEYMNPIASAHSDVTIIGPSVTNGEPEKGMGLAWLSRFQEACPDAIVHATSIHFYDVYNEGTIDRFKAQVEKAFALTKKSVWVTEFGLNPGSATPEQAASFLKEAMAYMDASDKVQGYAWFMVGDGENQLNSGNSLSSIGQVYAAGY